MMNTEMAVKNALASTLNYLDPASIELHHHLRDDLELDSMGALMFLMKLEETIDGFFVDPDTLELRDLETVSSIVDYIDMQRLMQDLTIH